MKTVYFISGLGADKRAFSFLDLSFCNPVFIDWIEPLKNESLKAYAIRLQTQITDPSPTVVGVSFGGMLATEMGKVNPWQKTIIISSNKLSSEFPSHLRIGKYLPVYKWLPLSSIKRTGFLQHWFFKPKGTEQKKIFNSIIKDADNRFTQWAIEAILKWENKLVPEKLTHIHGTKDNLLYFRKVKADYKIENGTHLMIMNNAAEISNLLREII